MKFKVGEKYIQRIEKEPSTLTGHYLHDARAKVVDIDSEWVYCSIFPDVLRPAKFNHDGIREDGNAWLVDWY